MTTETTTDRVTLQQRANRLMSRILDRYGNLTAIAWTVADARCRLDGKVSTDRPAAEIRAIHAAWCAALGLDAQPEAIVSASTRGLLANGDMNGVRVTLTAVIYAEDGS